ncbi:MAG: hypothetical protein CR979_02540, partial [Propionibacterium sp.]
MKSAHWNIIITANGEATVNGTPVEMVVPNVYSSVFKHLANIAGQLGKPVLARGVDESKGGSVSWFTVDAEGQAVAVAPPVDEPGFIQPELEPETDPQPIPEMVAVPGPMSPISEPVSATVPVPAAAASSFAPPIPPPVEDWTVPIPRYASANNSPQELLPDTPPHTDSSLDRLFSPESAEP